MASMKHFSAGFSLVEVLVSVVVLSVGLLGAVSLLLASARTSNEAATFTAAVNLVRDLSEKARMNKGIAARNDPANAYLVERWTEGASPGSAGPSCGASNAACDAAQLAAWDMREWKQRIAAALPDARVSVCFDETPWSEAEGAYTWACSQTGHSVVVKLGWMPRGNEGAGKPNPPPRLVMQLVPGHSHDGRPGS
ncbi:MULTISPECIES: type IV pilus modification protein PilV [unclassified Variovorax]|jgi:type IV pilus assembly protein PilV|uniref:type IV pilus modification protein PilV n=1 Tax=unclassified Variovorax TaxID=663243 RepID=UPI0008CEF7AE|nr:MULTISPECIES: type IV pilus modification protein PilV [unclassified Variovorax]SEK02657.1 type IV pilus assembly protein PilV [Variovorax sp. OK202]SFD34539.1 type IV pilus assembly protein PilV [Variovorax sp. OK212]